MSGDDQLKVANEWIHDHITSIAYVKSAGGTVFSIRMGERQWNRNYHARGDDDAPLVGQQTLYRRMRSQFDRRRQRIRAALLERDGDKCHWCGDVIETRDMSIEHIQPISRGGSNELANLKLAHKECNR